MPLGIITKNTPKAADLWPFRRLHRSETRHPRLALVPDTHTENSDSWLNAFRNYYKKHTRNQTPDSMPYKKYTTVADLWPFQRLHRSETRHPGSARSPWYTHGKIRHPGSMPLGIITRKDSFPPFERLTFTDCVFGKAFFGHGSESPKSCVQNWKSGHVSPWYSHTEKLARLLA